MTTDTLSTPADLAGVVERLKQLWRGGTEPNTARVLQEHPSLLLHRSLLVDLAYEEYCLREVRGGPPETDEFCRQFPEFQSHLREVIRGHRQLADHFGAVEAPAPVWPRPGDYFEGLVLVEELGRGMFARVYLAREPETGDRPVVLKLSPFLSAEARTLGSIRHPHIVSVLWARRVGPLHAICMPFVGSATLKDVLTAGTRPGRGRSRLAASFLPPVPCGDLAAPSAEKSLITGRESFPEAVATLAARLADALGYLHGRGIAHGDLKPSNVLIGTGGHPYLIDFNLAACRDGFPFRCGGTLPYMSPERLRFTLGVSTDPGPPVAVDVFAFGVVLFESLTGRLPFVPINSDNPTVVAADLLRQHAAAPARAAAQPGIPPALARIIDCCLAQDLSGRPDGFDEVKRELDRYLGRRRRRALLAVACAAILGSVVAGRIAADPPTRVTAGPTIDALRPTMPVKPATADEFFARGLRLLREGDPAAAMKDFGDASLLRPDGRAAAYRGYCLTLSGNHPAATGLYRQAVDEYDYAPAWVYCNWSYSLFNSRQYEAAVREASRAVALDPTLAAARYNRASAKLSLALARPDTARHDPECLADVRAVVSGRPQNDGVYYTAAVVMLTFGDGTEADRIEAIRLLQLAVQLGRPAASLAKDPVVRSLSPREDFKLLLRHPVGTRLEGGPNPHLAPPPLDD